MIGMRGAGRSSALSRVLSGTYLTSEPGVPQRKGGSQYPWPGWASGIKGAHLPQQGGGGGLPLILESHWDGKLSSAQTVWQGSVSSLILIAGGCEAWGLLAEPPWTHPLPCWWPRSVTVADQHCMSFSADQGLR